MKSVPLCASACQRDVRVSTQQDRNSGAVSQNKLSFLHKQLGLMQFWRALNLCASQLR